MKNFPKQAYKALQSIVGAEYVSDDQVVCETYTWGGEFVDTLYQRGTTSPGCVVLPRTTSEVQKIIKLCNRYGIPFKPIGSFWGQHCAAKIPEFLKPGTPSFLSIDLKRMNTLEFDEKNMYAIVEPGVIYSPMQEQAMRRGLYTLTPGGGSQACVIGNHINHSFSPLCYRVGLPSRRILGGEWVLADGEILRFGSLASQDDPFWGEGPGVDLRGLLRGTVGWWGKTGIVTKLAVKLHPLFKPERLKPIGISPSTTLEFPTNRIRWYNITMPNLEALFTAMREIGKAEIGAAIMRVPMLWRYRAKAKTREHFWELWEADEEEIRKNPVYILRILLIGYTSEKQLQYEERVLQDIIAELGGEFRRTRPTDESWIKNADSAGMWWPAGGYVSVEFIHDTLGHSIARGETLSREKETFIPPLVDEYGEKGWYQMVELGHASYFEFLIQWDPYQPTGDYVSGEYKAYEFWVDNQRVGVDEHQYISHLGPMTVLGITGAAYGPNYYPLMEKVRRILDPNEVSDPPFDMHDRVIAKWAPEWKKKYRLEEYRF